MHPLAQKFFGLSAGQKRQVHLILAGIALKNWQAFVQQGSIPLAYNESVCGSYQEADLNLPSDALVCINQKADSALIASRYHEPINALQDEDWSLPDDAQFAYYAIYNSFRKYALKDEIDDWLIVNQALSSFGNESQAMDAAFARAIDESHRPLWLFLALAFIPAWTVWFLSGVSPRAGAGVFDYRWLFAQVGVFAPSLAALIVSGLSGKELRRNSLRILPVLLLPLLIPGILTARNAPSGVAAIGPLPALATVLVGAIVILFFSPLNRRLLSPGTGELQAKPDARWLFVSIAFFPALFLAAWFLANLQGGGWAIAAAHNGAAPFAWIVLVSFMHNLLLGGPLGEELGWRGFLLPRLLERHGPLAASLVLAVVWALWHAPIDLYAGFLVQGPGALLARIIWTIPVTILFTWIYQRCRGALLAALFLHSSIGMLSALGFSAFPSSMMIYFLLLTFAAFAVVIIDPVFHRQLS